MEIFMFFGSFMFIFVFGFFIFIFYTIIKQTKIQNNSPVLTSQATLMSKRDYHSKSFTYYYGTFEFPSGDRIELELPRDQAGLIVEGDQGQLTYKGRKMLSFLYEGSDDLY